MASIARRLPRTSLLAAVPRVLPNPPLRFLQLTPKRNAANMTPVSTKNAMLPVGPYSQAMKTPHAIYVSGQLPASAGVLVTGSIGDKTAACINGLSAILEEAGSSLDKIVKVQVFLTDMKNFNAMNEVYASMLVHKPARTCVAVRELPKGVDIEIECIALP